MKRYIRASFDNWIPDWLRDDKNALRALSANGIDLKNATFSTSRTGKNNEQYIVYHLVKSSPWGDRSIVYIPGVYNDEERLEDPYDKSYKAIKYISKKNLPIKDTVYVNIADNAKAPKERYQDPRKDNSGKYAGQYYEDPSSWSGGGWSSGGRTTPVGRYGYQKRDKSGYVIPNPDEKLLKFYSSPEGVERLASAVQDVYNQLLDIKQRIFDIDFTQFGEDYTTTAYENIMHRFGGAVRDYRIALNDLKSAQESAEDDSIFRKITAQNAFRRVRSIKNDISRINKILETGED